MYAETTAHFILQFCVPWSSRKTVALSRFWDVGGDDQLWSASPVHSAYNMGSLPMQASDSRKDMEDVVLNVRSSHHSITIQTGVPFWMSPKNKHEFKLLRLHTAAGKSLKGISKHLNLT